MSLDKASLHGAQVTYGMFFGLPLHHIHGGYVHLPFCDVCLLKVTVVHFPWVLGRVGVGAANTSRSVHNTGGRQGIDWGAEVLVVNKCDLASQDEQEEVLRMLRTLNEKAEILQCPGCSVMFTNRCWHGLSCFLFLHFAAHASGP